MGLRPAHFAMLDFTRLFAERGAFEQEHAPVWIAGADADMAEPAAQQQFKRMAGDQRDPTALEPLAGEQDEIAGHERLSQSRGAARLGINRGGGAVGAEIVLFEGKRAHG